MQVSVKVPGSCGELIQGMIRDVNFLVTCPIDCYSVVTIRKREEPGIKMNVPGKIKLLAAINETTAVLGLGKDTGYDVILNSDLPIGKGMASSTADMTAAIIAIGLLDGRPLSEAEISRILLKIEPSDGIFYRGIVAFDHIHGSFYENIGEAFPANFLIYDYGGEIDTIKFNSDPDLLKKNIQKMPIIEKAYEMVKESFAEKDIQKLGRAVTLSALENQKILFKDHLDEIIDYAALYKAYGVNVAHSGTLVGILNDEKTDIEGLKGILSAKFPELTCLGNYRMVNGGYQYSFGGEEFVETE